MKWGLDVDGCFADFNSAYIDLINSLLPVGDPLLPVPGPHYPAVWDYPQAAGVSKDVLNAAWDRINNDDHWWANLRPYADASEAIYLLNMARCAGDDLYFITSRSGDRAKSQTEVWLIEMGIARPTVLISSDKGPIVKGLKLDIFIDDKLENCGDVAVDSPTTLAILVDRPYNQRNLKSGVRRAIGALGAVKMASKLVFKQERVAA